MRSEGLVRAQLLQAFRVRLLMSWPETFSQDLSGGSRLSSRCKEVVALAGGDEPAQLDMALVFLQYSSLLSLMRAAVSQVAVSLSQHLRLKGGSRDISSLLIGSAERALHLGAGLPTNMRSEGLVRA